jgi:hypothetical protein
MSGVHWSGIRADRLSSHHGEFCKLFCSQTSRQVDFFSDGGAQSGWQLLNMISMCTAFSIGNQLLRPNFCSLFDVEHSDLDDVKSALEKVRKGAVGQPISKILRDLVNVDPADHSALKLALEGVQAAKNKPVDLKTLLSVDTENHAALKSTLEEWKMNLVSHSREPGVIDFRNMLAHNLLSLEARHFDALVACARTMLAGVCIAHRFVCPNAEYSDCAERSLAEIDRIIERDLSLQGLDSTLTDHERDGEQMLEERTRLLEECDRLEGDRLVRRFDSFAPCLKKDIEDQLVESNCIGRGGQGSVHRVKHWLWGQPLAVKVFHDTATGHAWQRELNSLAFLNHPNVVRVMCIVYETLDDRRQCCPPAGYAMELMALSAADPREFTLAQLLSVFVQIASALTFCHENGVVHFNVKPATILLDETCSVAKLANFGCSRLLQSEVGRENQVLGTLLYMAPEQFHADFESNPKLCDIYSLGKTMWKLLHPTLSAVPFSECQVNAHVPPALKELVEQCTMRDPSARPRDMCEVLRRLQIISQEHHDAPNSASATSSATSL